MCSPVCGTKPASCQGTAAEAGYHLHLQDGPGDDEDDDEEATDDEVEKQADKGETFSDVSS